MKKNIREERIGQRNINKQGLWMEVVDYTDNKHVLIAFDDGTLVTNHWQYFKEGAVINPNYYIRYGSNLHNVRLGEERVSNQGYKMKIVEYKRYGDIVIQIGDDKSHTLKTNYGNFKRGNIGNPFIPSLYGHGIVGNEYATVKNGHLTKEYRAWSSMITRCYSDVKQKDHPSYIGCQVSEEFLYYPNFYRWIIQQENYEIWKTNSWFALDKDILVKNNNVYAPDRCCLVPPNINTLFKPHKYRNHDLPPGVHLSKNKQKYVAKIWNPLSKKKIRLGTFDSAHQAFLVYKEHKEKLIKEIANIEYAKGTISKKCRDALINYIVEETD